METKQPNLAAFNEWICVKSHHNIKVYSTFEEHRSYWFHEDAPPNPEYFKLVVDETDTPIKKLVRWD